ncbi:hypothetical protein [Acetobacter peroxydans]|jgi:hypothetical protein|uniref:hypothetical protein n=1 Tax=Acetobacter peroxydans TaxID=104098 RepID=UPI0023558128|nr:hypothetical protein [Acetobacter peroxydans]MCI1724643.1 hypothetical protein [Acetobacter peroxydans]
MPIQVHIKSISGAVCVGLLLLSGCTSTTQRIENKEDHLAAAGFAFHLADNPQREAMLNKLPAHHFVRRIHDNQVFYVYADPTVCNWLYVGDQKAFSAYQQYRQQKALADEQQETAADYQDATWDWGGWEMGPAWAGWNPAWGNWNPGMGGYGW